MHGAKAREHVIARDVRTVELAEAIRAVVPVYDDADAYTVQALAVVLVRIERAEAALSRVEAEADASDPAALYRDGGFAWVDNLRGDLRKWLSVAERYFSSLGMSPGSRARLGLDIARARHLTVAEWHQAAALEAADDEEGVVE